MTPSAAKERAEEVAALIHRMMALPNDPGSRRDMKKAGREALALLAADRLPDPAKEVEIGFYDAAGRLIEKRTCQHDAVGNLQAWPVPEGTAAIAWLTTGEGIVLALTWPLLPAPVSAAVSPADTGSHD